MKKVRKRIINSEITSDSITEIHKKILQIFEDEWENLPTLKKQLKNLQWISQNGDPDERAIANNEIEKLSTKINLIESGRREAMYHFKADEILNEYSKLLNKPVKIDFTTGVCQDNSMEKRDLIIRYLGIAQNYTETPTPDSVNNNLVCEDCNTELKQADDLLFVCEICGLSVKNFASNVTYQEENSRINTTQRYVYDKRGHFGDAIKKFQGIQNTTIPPQVKNDLKNKAEMYELSPERITKDHIVEFLKLTGHTSHNEDLNLLHYELTGIPPPNITHLETKLFKLYAEIEPVYERIKPSDRINFLNGQYLLFKLLQKLRFPCKEDDFYILKTREKLLEHDQWWKLICEELQWTFIPTV